MNKPTQVDFIITHPFDAFLKQTRYLSLSNGMHQFSGCMMRRNQFHAINKAIQFLTKEHNVAALPNGVFRLQPQSRQSELVEPMLEDEYEHSHQHAHAE